MMRLNIKTLIFMKSPISLLVTYQSLYGVRVGRYWTLPKNFENPRHEGLRCEGAVCRPVRVGLGCGRGVNTQWIAESGDGSHWTGVDAMKPKKWDCRFLTQNIFCLYKGMC